MSARPGTVDAYELALRFFAGHLTTIDPACTSVAGIGRQAVEASYANAEPIATDAAGPNMRRLAADHRRLLGNGHCTRPTALDCQFETICERCGFFDTGPQFVTILNRQRDHAAGNDQPDRAALFTDLLNGIDAEA